MFDFDERRKVCTAAIKKAYAVRLHGGDRRVMDGSWRELFADGNGGGGGEVASRLSQHEDIKKGRVGRKEDGNVDDEVEGEVAKDDATTTTEQIEVNAGEDQLSYQGSSSKATPATKKRKGGAKLQVTLDRMFKKQKDLTQHIMLYVIYLEFRILSTLISDMTMLAAS
ncbi:hypothetical protein QBC46DRAFT_449995 [Diplogelasinospora grovesii]|uniref:Uncharacterized protein n=1 Tax=Diplogelasinospora grovesii TaxID=303347 RepID=A0AAN6S3P0_9PEZI|nr:hypothetical protein QBC46DRAFT_449995 [Diplogelasinospora grovesii]